MKATTILAEEEVEHELRKIIDSMQEALASVPLPERTPEIVMWQTPFYDIKVISFINITEFI